MLPQDPKKERSKEVRCMEESFLPGDKTDLPVLVTRYLQADPGSRRAGSEKFTWRAQGAYCGPWGPLYLRQEPAGSCEHAPRMNQRGYLFSFCRQTRRVWCIRMAIRFETAQRDGEKRKRESTRKRFISRHSSTWPCYRDRHETNRRRSPQGFNGSTDMIAIKILMPKASDKFHFHFVSIIILIIYRDHLYYNYIFSLILHFSTFKNFSNFHTFLYLIPFFLYM